MILTPKNWSSFQHYKDRAPAWIKLHRGLLDDYQFCCLPVASKALAPFLWLLASEYEDGKIVATLDELAFRLRMTRGELADALSPLVQAGFFDASEPLAECKPDAIPEKEVQVKEEVEKNSRRVADATPPRANAKFDEFWKEYPKRDGDNPRKPAEKKFNALVKTGVDPDAIIAGAKRASQDARRRNIYGTPYVPQAIKFLNDQRFLDIAVAAAEPELSEVDWPQVVAMWRKSGHWSRWAGPDPDSPACRCPPELLERQAAE